VLTAALVAIGCNVVAKAATIHGERVGGVRFVNSAGRPTQGPVLDVNGLYPDMTPRRTLVNIWNQGSSAAHFEVSLVERLGGPGPSLADALHVVVSRDAGVVYRGPLSGLRFAGPALRAGQAVRVYVSVSWPSQGTLDERYVGARVNFSLIVDSWPA